MIGFNYRRVRVAVMAVLIAAVIALLTLFGLVAGELIMRRILRT